MSLSLTAEAWSDETAKTSGITTRDLDQLAKSYQEAYAQYEAAKAVSTDLYKRAEELEGKLIEAMEQCGKQKYHVDGLGLFYFSDKYVVKTPKTVAEKKALFMWLRQRHGEMVYLDKISINHQTLQALYKAEFELAAAEGNANFHIPGLESPTSMRSLNFRKERG